MAYGNGEDGSTRVGTTELIRNLMAGPSGGFGECGIGHGGIVGM